MKLEDLEIYKISLDLSNKAWEIYATLPKEYKYNIGSQFIRSTDSIGANIAEGFGRFHYLDSVRFYYNSRGSLFETKHWIQLLHERKLMDDKLFNTLEKQLRDLSVKLNNFISSIKKRTKQ